MDDSKFERVWAACDRLLLAAVAVLLCAVWVTGGRSPFATFPAVGQSEAGEGRAGVRRPARDALGVERVVGRLNGSLDRERVNSIARSMVEAGWEASPACTAMDMREDGRTCEVYVALPEGVLEESVRVSAANGVLTLSMRDGATGKTYLQRVRIPCGLERSGTIVTAISNDVINVRIAPAGG